jgi:3-hydroxyacyl-[acyl-carrier-protein] dehydratase
MWIDRIVELTPSKRAVAIKNVTLAEEHLHDHFAAKDGRPALPIVPASLIIEGMAQTAGILVGHAAGFKEKVILAKVGLAQIDREVGPGQTLRYTADVQQLDRMGAATTGLIEVMDHGASPSAFQTIGKIELMFSYLDQNMAGIEFPAHNFVFSDSFRTLLRLSGVQADF